MKYIDSEKLIAEIERQQRRLVLLSTTGQVDVRRDCALQNGAYEHVLTTITSLQQEQPMPNSTELIAKWEEEKDVLKQMDFRGDEWRLAQNAFMDGVGIGLSVRQEQPLTIEKVVEQCKKFGGNPEVIQLEAAVKAFAETYSFNIESKLFNQLSGEQQELWRTEIEQAVINGGEVGLELAKDTRYRELNARKEE